MPGVVRDFDAGRIGDRLSLPVIAQVSYPSGGIGITGVVSREEDPVDQVQLMVRGQSRTLAKLLEPTIAAKGRMRSARFCGPILS